MRFCAWLRLAWPRIFYYILKIKKEAETMSDTEYRDAIFCAANIAEILTFEMDEYCQDLFEKYCLLQEKILKKELLG